MKRILIFSIVIFLLSSCHFFEPKKKGIVAEILCNENQKASSEEQIKHLDSAEVNRVEKLIMNPELLDLTRNKSKFPKTIDEIKTAISLENPENTTIIDIRYTGRDTNGVSVFLDSLLINLQKFEIEPKQRMSEQKIHRIQYQLDSLAMMFNAEAPGDSTSNSENAYGLYNSLLQKKASLEIASVGIISSIRILQWAHTDY